MPTTIYDSPETFLNAIDHATPGWIEEHGGLIEVINQTTALQQQLEKTRVRLGKVRAAAVAEEMNRTGKSGEALGQELGLSRYRISHLKTIGAANPMTW